MLFISSGSPKAFQRVIYYFWTGQNRPRLQSQRAMVSSGFKARKCGDANEVKPLGSAQGEEGAV